jgi:hypothetical protein
MSSISSIFRAKTSSPIYETTKMYMYIEMNRGMGQHMYIEMNRGMGQPGQPLSTATGKV